MKLTTIQITSEEDREIARLKTELGLPSKKAVVLEGLQALRELLHERKRVKALQAASRLVSKESARLNREWAPLATPLKTQ